MSDGDPIASLEPAENEDAVRRARARGCGGIFLSLMLIVAAVWGGVLGAFVWLLEDARTKIEALETYRPKVGSKIYSADGELLGEFTNQARQLVSLNEMPCHLQRAFLATEDDTFYEHKGVRPLAVVSALRDALRTGRLRGASTITQQIVRNIEKLPVGQEYTFRRKFREALISLQVERQYTKDEILELYLNQIFLGRSAWGVEAASQQYFNKSCRDLTLGESALLAALTRLPRYYEPIRHPDNARQRRDIVLSQMLKNRFITHAEYDAARGESVEDSVVTPEERAALAFKGRRPMLPNQFKAPYFVEEVRRRLMREGLVDKETLLEGGLRIETTLDMRLQRVAEDVLLRALDEFDRKKREELKKRGKEHEFVPVSGALVCIDNRPGAEGFVRALVGGRDWEKEKFNTATQARRQPGSSIKPFVWGAAFHHLRYTPSKVIVDAPYSRVDAAGNVWRPKNFGGTHDGPVTLRRALEKSINIVSVKLVEQVGMPSVRAYMKMMGFESEIGDEVGLTIALGTPVVTVMEQCVAYSTFAKGGIHCREMLVREVKDADRRTLYKGVIKKTRVLPENEAYLMTNLMEGVANWGTGSRTRALGRPRAGKTGTSNESRNVWFCGYTPDFTCVVWLGYRDNRPLGQGKAYTGGALAAPIWTDFMKKAHVGPPKEFPVPREGVAFYNVDKYSGTAGGDFREAFLEGTVPPVEQPVFPTQPPVEEEEEIDLLADF